jgi:pantoate--beta-alanine ligase
MQTLSTQWRQDGETIGFVPTMGFLHEGHLSLMRRARKKTDRVVVSIFVNPTQFAPDEDFDAYPRDFKRDHELCENIGVDAVFYPDAKTLYAPDASTWVEEVSLSTGLCGASRPTHFKGVTTVVTKLFNAVLPDLAVFGRKDAQQALVIQRMVRDLCFPVKVDVAPIVREEDGLAMSSRNRYLSSEQRKRALAISKGLFTASEAFDKGERSVERLKTLVTTELEQVALSIDYIALVKQADLQAVEETVDQPALLAVAAFVQEVRLIDNVFLET